MTHSLALDTETTGLNPSVDRVIELAMIQMSSTFHVGPIADQDHEWSSRFHPGRDFSS